MKLGTLDIAAVTERLDLLSPSVADAIRKLEAGNVGVAEIDPALSDTAAFCARYDVGLDSAANCVVLEAKRGDRTWYAACVVLGSTRADVNGLARRTLDARKASFAPMAQAVALTGMEYGAITPVGLPPEWTILIDKAVAEKELVIIGSGLRRSKLVLPGALLGMLPNAQVLNGLGKSVGVE